ncbi:hypothetical protein F2Q69_00008835 [Brassica cretica]|uniref:Uncharacterized protein n=1 Tax=Brassica cretica TaxID=69181 RepID=A0A8S9PHP5_BRACR|nr:hypothetical protein F2Q69_00008835 [Brassica cretica]
MANAFSELTDPVDQKARLEEHLRQHNAKRVATAPETSERKIMMKTFSLPWNKLVMLLTNSASIRDVIAFPVLQGSWKKHV